MAAPDCTGASAEEKEEEEEDEEAGRWSQTPPTHCTLQMVLLEHWQYAWPLAYCLVNGRFCTWLMGLSGLPWESQHQALPVECLTEGMGGGMSVTLSRAQTHMYNHSNTPGWFEMNHVPLRTSIIRTCRTIDGFFSCQRIHSLNISFRARKSWRWTLWMQITG